MTAPIIINRFPLPDATSVDEETLVSFDVYDTDTFVLPNEINVYINDLLAYDGYSFLSPFNGVDSYFGAISVDGYDGYRVVIDSTVDYANIVHVRALADDYDGESLTDTWSFFVGDQFNVLYFSDGEGLKAADVQAVTGESQDRIRTVLSTTTTPSIPNNIITFIHGEEIDGYKFLVMSFGTGTISKALWGFENWGSFVWG